METLIEVAICLPKASLRLLVLTGSKFSRGVDMKVFGIQVNNVSFKLVAAAIQPVNFCSPLIILIDIRFYFLLYYSIIDGILRGKKFFPCGSLVNNIIQYSVTRSQLTHAGSDGYSICWMQIEC